MTATASNRKIYLAAVFVIFFMGGLIASFNSIVVPHLKSLFALDYRQAMLIDFAFNITFLVCSYPAGILLGRKGYIYTLNCGLLAFAVGCSTIYPAIQLFSYPLILVSIFVLGIGFNLILVAGSPFLASLGDRNTSSSRITLGQAFMAVGQTLAPLLGSAYLLRTTRPDEMGSNFQGVYLVFAVTLLIVFFLMVSLRYRTPVVEEQLEKQESSGTPGNESATTNIWQHRQLVLACVGVFVYLGIEAFIASVFINFVSDRRIGNMPAAKAGIFLTIFWLCFTVARFVSSMVLRKMNTDKWFTWNVAGAMVVMTGVIFLKGPPVVALLILLASFNAIMFPSLYSLGIRSLGKLEAKGSGLLFMAISGAAVIPMIQGTVADHVGLQYSFGISLISYAYLLFYGLNGYRPKAV